MKIKYNAPVILTFTTIWSVYWFTTQSAISLLQGSERQAPEAAVKDVPRSIALSGLVANLPFVAETFPDRPELFQQAERSFADIPLFHLEFRKDDSYWDAIAGAGLASL